MSQEKQIKIMRQKILNDITNSKFDDLFILMLNDAECVALDTLYPYDHTIQELPNERRYKNWQVRCAVELYEARKRVGVQSYSENNLNVSFLTTLISSDLMNKLNPKAGIPK